MHKVRLFIQHRKTVLFPTIGTLNNQIIASEHASLPNVIIGHDR